MSLVYLSVRFFPDVDLFGAHWLRARRYDCSRFALPTSYGWNSLFRLVVVPELATLIPHCIASLSLIVTTAGGRPWNNLPPVSFTQIIWRIRQLSKSSSKELLSWQGP